MQRGGKMIVRYIDVQRRPRTPFSNYQLPKQKAPKRMPKHFSHTSLSSSIIVGILHKPYKTGHQCLLHCLSLPSFVHTTIQFSLSLRLTAPEAGGRHPFDPSASHPAEMATRCHSRKLGWRGRDIRCCCSSTIRFYRPP